VFKLTVPATLLQFLGEPEAEIRFLRYFGEKYYRSDDDVLIYIDGSSPSQYATMFQISSTIQQTEVLGNRWR